MPQESHSKLQKQTRRQNKLLILASKTNKYFHKKSKFTTFLVISNVNSKYNCGYTMLVIKKDDIHYFCEYFLTTKAVVFNQLWCNIFKLNYVQFNAQQHVVK